MFCNRVKVGFQVVEPPQQRTYSCDYLRLFYIITSAKKAMFLSAFVCLLGGLRKNYSIVFPKVCGKVAHGTRKKPSDCSGNSDHVTLGNYSYGWWSRATAATLAIFYRVIVSQ